MKQRHRIRKHIHIILITRHTLPILVNHARRADRVEVVHPYVVEGAFEVEDAGLAGFVVAGGRTTYYSQTLSAILLPITHAS